MRATVKLRQLHLRQLVQSLGSSREVWLAKSCPWPEGKRPGPFPACAKLQSVGGKGRERRPRGEMVKEEERMNGHER